MPLITLTINLKELILQENMMNCPSDPAFASLYDRKVLVDITSNIEHDGMGAHRHLGIECCHLVKDYVEECWVVEPLLLVLKQLLKINGLNEPFKGGMSSYGLLLMIVGYLQHNCYD